MANSFRFGQLFIVPVEQGWNLLLKDWQAQHPYEGQQACPLVLWHMQLAELPVPPMLLIARVVPSCFFAYFHGSNRYGCGLQGEKSMGTASLLWTKSSSIHGELADPPSSLQQLAAASTGDGRPRIGSQQLHRVRQEVTSCPAAVLQKEGRSLVRTAAKSKELTSSC